jgi:trans-2,3-dihydro-3-hydroxyanthranilate isomerase
VTYQVQAGQIQSIKMRQPLPTFGPIFTDRAAIAEMLSLDLADLNANLPLEVVSCGVPFLFVPVNSLAAMRAIRFRLDVWERVDRASAPQIFAFSQETEHAGSTVHSRMFAPALGVMEDPATGAASGPLGCYLLRHGLVNAAGTGTQEIVSEQGIEMGRPSFIHISIEHKEADITGVYVGGECYFIGEGTIVLSEALL